ncbi:MAG: alpha-glucan family phosphorylase [Saprospiraceae bacterium]
MISQLSDNQVKLKRIFIENQLPEKLQPLRRMAHNIYWSWNHEAAELFKSIDPAAFVEHKYNPLALLDQLPVETVERLEKDKDFLGRLKSAEKSFDAYLNEKPKKGLPRIAYFSMEYGLHISLRLYSGGLGVLAGDYLKEASDSNVNLFGVGLLYRYGYFNQALGKNGEQIHQFPPQEFTKLPIEPVRTDAGDWLIIPVNIQGRVVQAKVWKLPVGRIDLYLLDTDFEANGWDDRALTHQLYGGDNEHRLKQEILLGIGGVQAVKAMGLEPDLWHLNEGHASFLSIERLKDFVAAGMSFAEAVEAVRAASLYTTHTPVPAGHDHFPVHLMQNYLGNYAQELGVSWREFMALGRANAEDEHEDFNMSNLAIRLSQQVNGVSKLHGLVSQQMFTKLFPGYTAEEMHIGYVTNSVHYPTWISNKLHTLYSKHFGKNWVQDQSNPDRWRKVHDIADADLMAVRRELKKELLTYVRAKIEADMRRRGESPRTMFDILNNISEDAIVFGFARRFATYKRALLLFTNRDRLREIVNRADRPVLFLFAGKAHPADQGGQYLIKEILNISKDPEFAGKVIFLEDYNMEMAKLLVRGVDIWLNTPTRPLEASGTSGMKAAMNGVMNFSVLDGWWAEGYRPDAGWALPIERTYEDQNLQNELDAERIYSTLESDIIPTYFDRNEQGISSRWMSFVKQIIAEVAPEFTMKRMLDDYYDRFYLPLYEQTKKVRPNDYKEARSYAAWKEDVKEKWSGVSAEIVESTDSQNQSLPVGEDFTATVRVHLNGIAAESIQVEVVFYKRLSESKLELRSQAALKRQNTEGDSATFTITLDPQLSGVFEYGFRVRPTHQLMPHPQDLALMTWA